MSRETSLILHQEWFSKAKHPTNSIILHILCFLHPKCLCFWLSSRVLFFFLLLYYFYDIFTFCTIVKKKSIKRSFPLLRIWFAQATFAQMKSMWARHSVLPCFTICAIWFTCQSINNGSPELLHYGNASVWFPLYDQHVCITWNKIQHLN